MRGRPLLVSGLTILLLLASGMAVFAFTRSLQMATRWTGMGICSVSMTSPTEGWAVGDITGPSSTLLLHYTAGHWTVVAPPAGLDRMAELSAVAMVSRDEGWAVGWVPVPLSRPNTFRPGGLVLHYHGGKWTIATLPQREKLTGVAARSATDVWAVGYGLVLHYDGARWAEVPVPQALNGLMLTTVSLPSDGSVWVAGGDNTILRYDGHTWQRQDIPGVGNSGLNITDLAMTSATTGWAVGTIYNSPRGVILRDVGGRWVVEQETNSGLVAISMPTSGEGWAVGSSLIMRYSQGRWTTQSTGEHYLLDVAMASSSDAWAVGPGQMLHFRNGGWQNDDDLQWEQDALRRHQGG